VRSWFALPSRRVTEASPAQIAAVGAAATSYGTDPIDGDRHWRRAGRARREVPQYTREEAVTKSVALYRINPMARAIIDTYTSFCVGDKGVTYTCTNDDVRTVVEEFWNDPRNNVGGTQDIALRSQMLFGERVLEMMVGQHTGVVRYCPIDPASVEDVELYRGNPNWPSRIVLSAEEVGGEPRTKAVVQVDDETGLRDGEAMLWTPWRTTDTDVRSQPFLMPVIDWLANYDDILSNLIDRTFLARWLVWDVTVEGDQSNVDEFIAARGGSHAPSSGGVEVHTSTVKWEPKTVQTGAEEDSVASKSALTLIAGGAGLAKTWLADPEDSNRATSLTMAEPVRRRVGGVQQTWLCQQTELVRFAVDRAVAAGRLPAMVDSADPRTGKSRMVPASMCVQVTGPEIAAADSQIAAQVLLNLSTGLEKLVMIGALTPEAAQAAAEKAWEDYVGVPYDPSLGKPDANRDDIATAVEDSQTKQDKTPLRAVK
jgi:hypothetical protein